MTLFQAKHSNDGKLESTAGAGRESFPCLASLLAFECSVKKHCWIFSIPRESDLERGPTLCIIMSGLKCIVAYRSGCSSAIRY